MPLLYRFPLRVGRRAGAAVVNRPALFAFAPGVTAEPSRTAFVGQTIDASAALVATLALDASGSVDGAAIDATVSLTASTVIASSGGVSIAASGAISAAPVLASTGALALSASAALSATPSIASSGSISLAATGALSVRPALASSAGVSIAGTAALGALPALASSVGLSLAGSAALSIAPTVASSGALSLSASAALSTAPALVALGAVSLDAALALVAAPVWSGSASTGNPGPRASRYPLRFALPVRDTNVALPVRSMRLAVAHRTLSVALAARSLSLSIPRRSLVSSVQSLVKGDTTTLSATITVDSGTIAQPTSLAAVLYPAGSSTPAESITVDPADCTGWGTASVVVPVEITAADTPVAGRYSLAIVATYVDGPRTWPSNVSSAIHLDVVNPGGA